jgi:hypothetical protein
MRITIDTETKILEVESPVTVDQAKEMIFDLANDWWRTYQIIILPEEIPAEGYVVDTPWPTREPYFDEPSTTEPIINF